MDLANRHGIVTGAGSGIGRALAVEFGRRRGALLLVGRRADALQETAEQVAAAGGMGFVHAADLTVQGTEDRIAEAAAEALGPVDLLVNNAGNTQWGRIEEASADEVRAMVALNLTAPILLTKTLLPTLRAAENAIVLNVSSGLGLVGMPFSSLYGATKSGLSRFSEAVRRESLDSGVHVATVYPGPTITGMLQNAVAGDGARTVSEVVADLLAGLERGDHEINTAPQDRQEWLRRNAEDPLGLDATLAPQLAEMEAALRENRQT